jgi:hypothetical protein
VTVDFRRDGVTGIAGGEECYVGRRNAAHRDACELRTGGANWPIKISNPFQRSSIKRR